jgi:hypothetical protein
MDISTVQWLTAAAQSFFVYNTMKNSQHTAFEFTHHSSADSARVLEFVALAAVGVLAVQNVIISYLPNKSPALRRFGL